MKHIGEVMTELGSLIGPGDTSMDRGLTPLDREFWVRPCPWCGEVLEPIKVPHVLPRLEGRFYWQPGIIGHSCAGYDEAKIVQAERAEQRKKEDREKRWAAICRLAGLSERLLEMTMESFEADRQPEAFEAAQGFFERPQTLVFTGPVGTGKSHLSCAILHRWMREGFEREMEEPYGPWVGGRGLFITLPRLLLRIQATYRAKDPIETEESIIDHLCGLPLLVLDDLGKQKKSEFAQRVLFNVIDGRYVKGKHLIITSNLTGDEFAAEVGEAVASRIVEMGKVIVMRPLGDYRRQLSLELPAVETEGELAVEPA